MDADDCPPDPADQHRDAMLRMKEEFPRIIEQLDCAEEHSPCWVCPAARAYTCAVMECDSDILENVRKRG